MRDKEVGLVGGFLVDDADGARTWNRYLGIIGWAEVDVIFS